jgi:lipoprotein-anchoring transpeptidase ErfK/SrfK
MKNIALNCLSIGRIESTFQRQKMRPGSFDMALKKRFWTVFAAIFMLPVSTAAQNAPAPVEPVTPPVVVPAPTPAPVKPPAPVPAPKKKVASDGLKPGQYIWEKRAYDAKDLRIIAILSEQRIYVFDGDTLVALSTISSGKKGHKTPTGVFPILQKNVDHKSNIYSNAPMPYMQRLTWDGIALHAGHIPGYPASHGCIRLPLAFAKALYSVTKMNQKVVVLGDLSSPTPKPEPEPKPEPAPEPKVVPSVPDQPVPAPVEEAKPTPAR